MATVKASAAVSHVGRIRANNQDSGFAGRTLFLVADGMGGHAGGDVASAIATRRIVEADADYASTTEAAAALEGALIAANRELAETVADHSELTGMGTTVSAIILQGDRVVISHIGDSRIYLLRSGELSQISTDHTFVQRLVDAGRITAEEAMVHPRRSVLMRVLGDVESWPEIDSMVLDTRAGDRWMLCSDGLSGVVSFDELHEIMSADAGAKQVADRLVKASLDGGAPDNVTVVVVDIGEPPAPATPPLIVGSAAAPNASGAAAEPTTSGGVAGAGGSPMSTTTTVTLSGAPPSREAFTSRSATCFAPASAARISCSSSKETTPESPSEQSIQRSPGRASSTIESTSGELSTSPSTRISTERRGCTIASSAVMRPASTSRCTKVWSVVIWLSSPERSR